MSYRDDVEALQTRLAQLELQLSHTRRDRAILEASVKSEAELLRELDDVRRSLHARSARKLPVLAQVYIASPCHVSWDAMQGDDRVRFCGQCEKNVYNLSAMTRDEAEALLASKGETPCVRFYRRPDGTVLTADCPVGVRKKRIKRIASVSAGLALAATAAGMALTSRSPAQGGISVMPAVPPSAQSVSTPPATPAQTEPSEVMMGEPAMIEPVQSEPTHRPRMGRPMHFPRATGR